MAYDTFEITDTNLELNPARLPDLLAEAQALGYRREADHGVADAGFELDALHDVLSALFPCNWELGADLRVSDLDLGWWPGDGYPTESIGRILAMAAIGGSTITFLDFSDGDRDIYDMVFDGAGGYERRYLVRGGVPVRSELRNHE